MKSNAITKPSHIVKGDIFDALGFSPSEASALKVKADLLSAILDHIRSKRLTQKQLCFLLDEYQPAISNLVRGNIAQVSIEKLLRYADRLQLKTSIAIRPVKAASRKSLQMPGSRRSSKALATASWRRTHRRPLISHSPLSTCAIASL